MEWIFSLNDIGSIAKEIWKIAGNASVLAFHGTMGSGKTTFIHALCDQKKVKDIVGSPTFSIINEYAFQENGVEKKIYHIDLFRLKNEAEAVHAGVEDCLYSGHICLVEWPERILSLLPDSTFHVHIYVIDAGTRRLRIEDK
ncbi:MAG TPA: tRNA (adenosine(37)-N6)-threonylcarbamoyltransferase complex ATPase subunit type 1 TsaE [Chitinophagaceae bacterium]|nr:tRNA (adenosine(37)-N6)-threonylcarbamoyltransferase complex ATPase subunit type 1 TsaE [Chitinophagaceae bacterium]